MNDRRPDSRMLLAFAVIAAIAIVVGLQMCGGADTSSPEAAVESYFAAIAEGDAEEACGIATEDFREAAVASVIGTPSEGESCEATVENVPDEAREVIEDVSVETVETEGDEAVVAVTIEAGDFPSDPVRFRAVRGEDGWLVAGLAEGPVPAS